MGLDPLSPVHMGPPEPEPPLLCGRHKWMAPCPGRNTSVLANALAIKSGNNKIINQDYFHCPCWMRLMTCLCPAMSSGLAPPLAMSKFANMLPITRYHCQQNVLRTTKVSNFPFFGITGFTCTIFLNIGARYLGCVVQRCST